LKKAQIKVKTCGAQFYLVAIRFIGCTKKKNPRGKAASQQETRRPGLTIGQRWAPAIFSRNPLPLVRYLEIVLPLRTGPQL
jgi:hypothetical protein